MIFKMLWKGYNILRVWSSFDTQLWRHTSLYSIHVTLKTDSNFSLRFLLSKQYVYKHEKNMVTLTGLGYTWLRPDPNIENGCIVSSQVICSHHVLSFSESFATANVLLIPGNLTHIAATSENMKNAKQLPESDRPWRYVRIDSSHNYKWEWFCTWKNQKRFNDCKASQANSGKCWRNLPRCSGRRKNGKRVTVKSIGSSANISLRYDRSVESTHSFPSFCSWDVLQNIKPVWNYMTCSSTAADSMCKHVKPTSNHVEWVEYP